MIVFWFELNGVGGVPGLFLNIAKELNSRSIPFKLVAYKNSIIYNDFYRYFTPLNFYDLNFYSKKTISNFILNNDIIVSTMFTKFLQGIRTNPKFVFWDVTPQSLLFVKKGIKGSLKYLYRRVLILYMHNLSSLIFVDMSCIEFLKREYKIQLNNPKILLIPIPVASENIYLKKFTRQRKDGLTISFVSRTINWKMYPLLKLLSDINKFDKKKYIQLLIFTDNVDIYKNFIKKNGNFDVNIKYFENLSGAKLREFLANNSDLHISNATACLEGSSQGIPSLLIDSFTTIPNNYKYKWIFEAINYKLGELLDLTQYKEVGDNLDNILNKFINHDISYISTVSKKCYDYTIENHSLDNITTKLLKYISEAKAGIKFVKYYKRTSIKNNS